MMLTEIRSWVANRTRPRYGTHPTCRSICRRRPRSLQRCVMFGSTTPRGGNGALRLSGWRIAESAGVCTGIAHTAKARSSVLRILGYVRIAGGSHGHATETNTGPGALAFLPSLWEFSLLRSWRAFAVDTPQAYVRLARPSPRALPGVTASRDGEKMKRRPGAVATSCYGALRVIPRHILRKTPLVRLFDAFLQRQ